MKSEQEFLATAGATLDAELAIKDGGRVVCCAGLLATFYMPHGTEQEVRGRAVSAFEYFLEVTGNRLVWGADPKTGMPKRIAGTQIANPRSWVPKLGPHDDMEFVFHGGTGKDDANAYTVQGLWNEYPSYFSCSLPFSWVAGHPAGEFVRVVARLADILQPSHGYAGLALIPHVQASSSSAEMKQIVGLLSRFRGLELDFPSTSSIFLKRQHGIRGINWLTILDESWIKELGGEASLRGQLGSGIGWHPFKTGVVLQAGPHPLFGDVNRSEPMPAYEKVAAALKPIRIEDTGTLCRFAGFDEERTRRWLARFDR